ncbi:hypothetical protein HK104_000043 [Borealophlyctis nickersoniae]|nr:hypothetical protein HK104_000043 [Borealophlyctis nickersoniae]
MPEGPSGWVSDSGSEYRPSSAWDITDVDEHAELDPEDLELALGYLPGGAQPRTEGNGADIEEPPEVDEDVESVVSDATTTGLTVPGDRSDVASDTDDDSDIAVWLGDKGKQNASELPSLEEVPPRRLTERQRRREQRNAREQEIADFRGATIGVANEAFNDTLRIVLGKGEGSHDDRIRKYHELSPDDDLELDEDDDPNIPLIKVKNTVSLSNLETVKVLIGAWMEQGDFDPILEESSKPSAEIDAVKALYDELRTVIRDVWHSESLRETGPPPPIELDERPDDLASEQPATSHTSNRQQPMPIPGELESELREKTVSVIDQVLQQVAQVRETICEGHDPGMILRSDWESILNAAVLCNLPEK